MRPLDLRASAAHWGRLVPIALILLAAMGFFLLWSARVDRALLAAHNQLIDSQRTLQGTLSSATAQLELLRRQAEQELDDPVIRPHQPFAVWLQPVPGQPAFTAMPPDDGASHGNFTVGAPLPDLGSERAQEIEVAARLAPFFSSVRKNLSNVTWVYYYSPNRILALYPYEKDSIYWSDELLSGELLVNAAPARNPDRGYYWSSVYRDNAGKGLVCSVVTPVYDGGGRFRAVIGFDLAVGSMISYIKGAELSIGTPLITSGTGQLLAHPTLIEAGRSVPTLADALPAAAAVQPRTAARSSARSFQRDRRLLCRRPRSYARAMAHPVCRRQTAALAGGLRRNVFRNARHGPAGADRFSLSPH